MAAQKAAAVDGEIRSLHAKEEENALALQENRGRSELIGEQIRRIRQENEADEEKDRRLQEAVLDIQQKYGKNAILKGMNLEEGAMTAERNGQVGGHKA